ncbi:MAG TPA: hypothetical protein VF230_19255 [Acidimicrobiales bacterium]
MSDPVDLRAEPDAAVTLEAARRLAATLSADGEDLTQKERIVLTRALRFQIERLADHLGAPPLAEQSSVAD